MRTLKPVGLVILGVFGGLFASGSLVAALRQAVSGQKLTAIPVNNVAGGSGYFVRDSKTGACWLMVRARDDVSAALAPAPRESCEP
jgi:hypothetical protein